MSISNPFPSQLARLPWVALQRELLAVKPSRAILIELRRLGLIPLPRGHGWRRRDAPQKNDANQHWFVSVWRFGTCGYGQREFELQLRKLQILGFVERRTDSYNVRRYRITLVGVSWLEEL